MTSPSARSTASAPTGRTACFRHPRHVWIASCPDCTAWHLAGVRATPRTGDRAASAA
jgi:hypothetical protein